ncbi:hypothetical protein IQ07DRAFT_599976 [Pyrenochaeta sp. DS3sAY3a]|nr:hypothetical protein IQ07DRAFT_599976 [Pyrenochaeta sp. DS3sAY3a]
MDSFSKQPAMALDLANKRMQSNGADQEAPTVRMVDDNPPQRKTVRFAYYPDTHEIPAEMATWQEGEKADCPTMEDQLRSKALTKQAFRDIAEQEARDNAIVWSIFPPNSTARDRAFAPHSPHSIPRRPLPPTAHPAITQFFESPNSEDWVSTDGSSAQSTAHPERRRASTTFSRMPSSIGPGLWEEIENARRNRRRARSLSGLAERGIENARGLLKDVKGRFFKKGGGGFLKKVEGGLSTAVKRVQAARKPPKKAASTWEGV